MTVRWVDQDLSNFFKVSYQKNAMEKIFAFSLQKDIIMRMKNISSIPIIKKF